MNILVLFKTFTTGMLDYIARHNANYTAIEDAITEVQEWLNVQLGGSSSMPASLKQIFDRTGIVGKDSYSFTAGVLSGPDYNLSIPAGAFWNQASFFSNSIVTLISMLGRSTGTYYVNLDATGTPAVGTSPEAGTVYQFAWDAATHTVSAKALYAGVNILFDGDDYADQLTSAARAKSFTKVADRFEEIEVLLGKTVQTPASADTITINWSLGSHARIILNRATTTINMSGAYDSQKCTLELVQDVVGGRAVTFGANIQAGIDFTLPAALTVTGDNRDFLGFFYSDGNSKYNYVSLSRGY